jgi:SAM-dependent methyltransferase
MESGHAVHWGEEAVDLVEPSLPALKARFLVDHVPSTGRALEIGSGNGKILRTLAYHRPGLELHGCDVRDPTKPPDVYAFQRIVGHDLPFDAGSFDVVLVVDVLEHVADPRHLLTEASRVLRPGGRMVAFVPIEGERMSFYELFRRVFGSDTYRVTKEHIQAFTHREARSMIEERFEIRELRYAYHALGQLMDAAFFAATRLERLRNYWWEHNVFYNPHARDVGGRVGALNKLLLGANAVAAVESRLLARTRGGSAGILVDAVVRSGRSNQPARSPPGDHSITPG